MKKVLELVKPLIIYSKLIIVTATKKQFKKGNLFVDNCKYLTHNGFVA